MKKKMLFIINNLNCGGAEKALISLLQTIDYSMYDIDLLLFKKEGIFLEQIPKKVNLISEPKYYKYFDMSLKKSVKELALHHKLRLVVARILFGYISKTEKNSALKEQKSWKFLSQAFEPLDKEYDAAIGFLEKKPVYFCVDKVKAKKTIGWIHNDYEKLRMSKNIDLNYFDKLDNIITVSKECEEVLKRNFPKQQDKILTIHNIMSPKTIYKLAENNAELYNNESVFNILSVGRLSYQKGFDIAIEACVLLRNEKLNVKWYVLGEGGDRKKLQQLINEKGLQEKFYLLGIKENPYPYIKQADIYVQPSRFEGKSVAIDEAKILKKPIIVTNFSTAKDQIRNEVNGLIIEMTPEGIANGIKRLINNSKLRESLSENLCKEYLGNEDEIYKLYSLINNDDQKLDVK